MTIHFVALPHTRFDDVASSSCAYTVKGVRWSRMMQDLGWDFIVYGSGDHTPVDVNFVSCLSDQDREDIFGTDKAVPDLEWDPFTQAYWTLFHTRAHREIVKRWRDGDVIAVSASGWGGVDAFSDLGPVIEPHVGYPGIGNSLGAAFESYAWMHHVYGLKNIVFGRENDAVIPNFLDEAQFTHGAPPSGYLLYLGRMNYKKGVDIAAQIAITYGMPLIMAGAGAMELNGTILCEDGTHVADAGLVTYEGLVGPERRADLLAHANALLVPTRYIEPFGTVHAEAMLSGVPVLASDWGVFTETIEGDVDGATFHTLDEALEQLPRVLQHRQSDSDEIYTRAKYRFSMEAVGPRFDHWLHRLGFTQ